MSDIMKEIQKELGWIWNSQEEVWIDLFRRNMKNILAKKWIYIYDTTTRFICIYSMRRLKCNDNEWW